MNNIVFNFSIVEPHKKHIINNRKKYKYKRGSKINKTIIYYSDYAEIILSGKNYKVTTKVSLEDIDYCSTINLYYYNNYICTNGFIKLHKIIMNRQNLSSNNNVIDHINRNTLDNRRENLRYVTQSINTANTNKIIKGYRYRKDMNKYEVRIKYHQKEITIGYYNNEIEAKIAYEAAFHVLFPEVDR